MTVAALVVLACRCGGGSIRGGSCDGRGRGGNSCGNGRHISQCFTREQINEERTLYDNDIFVRFDLTKSIEYAFLLNSSSGLFLLKREKRDSLAEFIKIYHTEKRFI